MTSKAAVDIPEEEVTATFARRLRRPRRCLTFGTDSLRRRQRRCEIAGLRRGCFLVSVAHVGAASVKMSGLED